METAMKGMKEFIHHESLAGIALMVATVAALVFSNTPIKPYYLDLLDKELLISFGVFKIGKPLYLWINDGLMAIFFFLIGLELKREFISGHLSNRDTIALPIVGAIGGLMLPAMIYYWFNSDHAQTVNGWAIPAATDIAFALGVLSFLSNRIPRSAKVFLMTLAIFDDLAAILIIAIFYTADISLNAIFLAIIAILILLVLNRSRVKNVTAYCLVGVFLWACVLKSGAHATLAGIVTAFFIPINEKHIDKSPLHRFEHDLHPWVAFFILPVFALANAGLDLKAMSLDFLIHPVALGVGVGLFVGKQLGVFGFCWLAIKCFKINLPKDLSMMGLYGVAILTGIGFTMSLFITSLAFYDPHLHQYSVDAKLGILIGSILSAIIGFAVIRYAYRDRQEGE